MGAKECNKRYYETHKDKIREYRKGYKEAHLEEIKKRNKEYRKVHSDEIKEYTHKHYAENPVKRKEINKRWKGANREKINETRRKYYINHKEKMCEERKKRYYTYLDKEREWNKRWRMSNPDKLKEYYDNRPPANIEDIRRRKWLAKYGITPEEYNELFNQQEGRCAICHTHQSELKRKLDVDHNHFDNKVRGLLCNRCNVMLGMACDDISRLLDAVEYLRRML